jgi:hypothetical protein
MRATAVRLITENGRPVTVRSKDTSAFDPVEGTVSVAYVDVAAEGVFVPITESNKPDGLIQDGDRWCFVTEETNKDDLIVDVDATEWQAVYVDVKYPGPLKLVWRVQVRS